MLRYSLMCVVLVLPAFSQNIQVVDQFHEDGMPKVVLHYVDINNKLEMGKKTYYHPNGQKKKEGTYFNGSKDGTWTEWRDDGTRMEEATYENGEKHGPWIHWGKNGKKLKYGEYVRGEKDGVWVKYTPNGIKLWEKFYDHGEEID